MNTKDKVSELLAKRKAVGPDTPLGHRYSSAIEQLQNQEQLERVHAKTLQDVAELELAELF